MEFTTRFKAMGKYQVDLEEYTEQVANKLLKAYDKEKGTIDKFTYFNKKRLSKYILELFNTEILKSDEMMKSLNNIISESNNIDDIPYNLTTIVGRTIVRVFNEIQPIKGRIADNGEFIRVLIIKIRDTIMSNIEERSRPNKVKLFIEMKNEIVDFINETPDTFSDSELVLIVRETFKLTVTKEQFKNLKIPDKDIKELLKLIKNEMKLSKSPSFKSNARKLIISDSVRVLSSRQGFDIKRLEEVITRTISDANSISLVRVYFSEEEIKNIVEEVRCQLK